MTDPDATMQEALSGLALSELTADRDISGEIILGFKNKDEFDDETLEKLRVNRPEIRSLCDIQRAWQDYEFEHDLGPDGGTARQRELLTGLSTEAVETAMHLGDLAEDIAQIRIRQLTGLSIERIESASTLEEVRALLPEMAKQRLNTLMATSIGDLTADDPASRLFHEVVVEQLQRLEETFDDIDELKYVAREQTLTDDVGLTLGEVVIYAVLRHVPTISSVETEGAGSHSVLVDEFGLAPGDAEQLREALLYPTDGSSDNDVTVSF